MNPADIRIARAIVEASDPGHAWDSDYVGNESMTVRDALRLAATLCDRAKNDPADDDSCADGVSWSGWLFRVRMADADGCYCITVYPATELGE